MNLLQIEDDLSEMPDDEILAFSSEISAPDETSAKPEPQPVTPPKKPTEVAELDDYSSILAYT